MAKKLYFVINSLEGGGAERVLSNLANNFSLKGYQVSLVCLNTAEIKYEINKGCKIINLVNRVGKESFLNRVKYAWLTFYRLLKLLNREKPDCTICFMTTANLWGGLCCLILGLPYLLSERITPDYTVNTYNQLLQFFSYQVYKKSKAVVLPAAEMGNGFKRNKHFKQLNNFITIHNPINVFTTESSIRVYHKRFILAVGRLDLQKGFDLLINAYAHLRPNETDLLISGEGPERKNLEKQITDLGLERTVKLIGFKTNLQDYYAQADIFVLSSRNEGYPNVLVEAMGAGCPVISMNCEFGPSEIITNGYNGLLVENENVTALSVAINQLLNDKSLKWKLANNAKMINQTNSLEKITMNWENLILS